VGVLVGSEQGMLTMGGNSWSTLFEELVGGGGRERGWWKKKKKGMGKKKGVRWLVKEGRQSQNERGPRPRRGTTDQTEAVRFRFGGWYSYVIIT